MSDVPEVPDSEPSAAEADAWASIVANFGDRAELKDDEVTPEPINLISPQPQTFYVASESDDHYEPPEVPRVGLADGPRGAAWLGLLGGPTLFVIALLTGFSIPGWLGLFAVVAFLVSLGYLVATMRRDDDEPWDDGAVV